MSNHLILYPHCVPVKGKERGAIYNLQKRKIFFVPNSMIDLLEELRKSSIEECYSLVEPIEYLTEYVDFLLEDDLAFYTNEPNLFPPLPASFHSPEHIHNAVIEYDFGYDLSFVFEDLSNLLCKHVELRLCTENISVKQLESVLETYKYSTIRSSEVYMKYSDRISEQELLALYTKYTKVSNVIIYNARFDKRLVFANNAIQYISNDISDRFNKDFPTDVYIINPKFYSECLHFNPYYNKKVCITKEGLIKNCLKHDNSFGSISDRATLQTIYKNAQFTRLWFIRHDMIEDLKDKETRYGILVTNEIIESAGKYYLKQ